MFKVECFGCKIQNNSSTNSFLYYNVSQGFWMEPLASKDASNCN